MPGMENGVTLDLPSGLLARPATVEDADAIVELVAACEIDADGVVEVDDGDVAPGFDRHDFDPELDTLLVFDGGDLVAWAELYRWRGEADVRPSHRGRGIGAALLGWTEARSRELGDARVGQTKSDGNTAARDLFLANGYGPEWTSWMIWIALEERPAPPRVPAGISIRRYGSSDEHTTHELIDAAFSEWPGRNSEPFEVWASLVAHPNFAPELSPLAFDGDKLVGVVLSYDYPEVGEGWIQQLATRATHRRRGIAQALLRTAFGWFFERGRRTVGVSTDSRTGALALYEKVGMHVVRRYTRYTKDLG
jgi:GNAT superfamily N-acetyltransferase